MMNRLKECWVACCGFLLLIVSITSNASGINLNLKTNHASLTHNDIYYHYGPVLGTENSTIPNVYFIFYGNWHNDSSLTILPDFITNLSGSSYYNINTTYTYSNGHHIINKLNLTNVPYFDAYSEGKLLKLDSMAEIVKHAIRNHQLPLDPVGVYAVITSSDVEVDGACTRICSAHTYSSLYTIPLQIIWVGNPYPRCPSACTAGLNTTTSPNNNLAADAMVNLLAYEINGTVTDFRYTSWFDRDHKENSDKCAWRFGSVSMDANGAYYNTRMNGTRYLIQQNWLNAEGGRCTMSY